MGIEGVEVALGALHRVGAAPAGFLHHHGFNQKYIIRDAVFLSVLLDDWLVGFHFVADRQDFRVIFVTCQHHPCEAHDDQHDHQDQDGSTASGSYGNQFLHGLCDCFGGSGSIFSGFLGNSRRRSCRYPAAMCRLSGNHGSFLGCLGCGLRGFYGSAAHVLHGFHRGACCFDGAFGSLDRNTLYRFHRLSGCSSLCRWNLVTVEHFAFTGSLWDRRYRLLGCPFRSQLCLGRSNLLLVHHFLL